MYQVIKFQLIEIMFLNIKELLPNLKEMGELVSLNMFSEKLEKFLL